MKRAVLFILTFVFFNNTVFANNCADHSASDPSVPLCPAGSGVLSEVYPTRMATISTREGGPQFAGSFATQLFESQPNKPPVLVISGTQASCDAAKKIVSKNAPADKRELWLKNIECNTKSSWNWQQDFVQSYVNSDGSMTARFNPEYRSRNRKSYAGLPEALQSCGFEANEEGRGSTNEYMGGNIEGMPPDTCVLGDNVPEADRSFLCNGAQNIMIAPTSFMRVGHVDEIMKTVHTGGPPPCNFKILVGSVDLARELMAGSDEPNFIPSPNATTDEFCRAGQAGENIPIPSPRPRGGKTTTMNMFWKSLFQKSHAGAIPLGESNKKEKPLPVVDCTPRQFLKGIDTIYIGSRNDDIAGKLNDFAKDVEKNMASKYSQCGSVVERVPMLFEGRSSTSALSVFPNPTNGVSINGNLIFSDPNNKIFDQYLSKLSDKIGVKKRTVDTNFAHKNQGNLHCSTNLFRYCRPR